MANPQIIALDVSYTETVFTLRFALWFAITKNPQPISNGSQWVPSGTSAGATAAQNTAIQNGTMKEEIVTRTFNVGTPIAAIEAEIQQAWTDRNNELNGQGANQYYGNFFDGTTWQFQ